MPLSSRHVISSRGLCGLWTDLYWHLLCYKRKRMNGKGGKDNAAAAALTYNKQNRRSYAAPYGKLAKQKAVGKLMVDDRITARGMCSATVNSHFRFIHTQIDGETVRERDRERKEYREANSNHRRSSPTEEAEHQRNRNQSQVQKVDCTLAC